ncbi:hypothetical protein D3C72_2012930 [compost metagenome]
MLPGRALGRQAEADVGRHRHVREQCTVLRYVADQALVRRYFVGVVDQGLAVERQTTGIGEFKAGDHSQQRGFARPRRSDNDGAAAAGH